MLTYKEKAEFVKKIGEFIAEDKESGVVAIGYMESGYMNRYASVDIEYTDGSFSILPINDKNKGNIAKGIFAKVYGGE